ncbi:MAG: flagellar basal body P-ring formation chaperone FlgA, partial [bacterium]
ESLNGSNAYEITYRDLSGSAVRMPIYECDDIADLVMRVNCQNGRTLDMTLMEKPDVILRGDRVIVFFENNGLALTMIGKALEPGKMGERIKILNERSLKTILCKVTGDGEVEAY